MKRWPTHKSVRNMLIIWFGSCANMRKFASFIHHVVAFVSPSMEHIFLSLRQFIFICNLWIVVFFTNSQMFLMLLDLLFLLDRQWLAFKWQETWCWCCLTPIENKEQFLTRKYSKNFIYIFANLTNTVCVVCHKPIE